MTTKNTTTLLPEQQEFLTEYRHVVQEYVEKYQKEDDPKPPSQVFWTSRFDYDRIEEMPARFSELGKRLLGYDYAQDWEEIKELWQTIHYDVNKQAQADMQAWFDLHGYDPNYPPAPEMDLAPIKHKGWIKPCPPELKKLHPEWGDEPREVDIFKNAIQIGQLFITSGKAWRGEKEWKVWEMHSGYEVASFTMPGGRESWKVFEERLYQYATKVTQLTDFSRFKETTSKQKRSMQQKLGEYRRELFNN